MKKVLFIILFAVILLTSCTTLPGSSKIVRWSEDNKEMRSTSFKIESGKNIFNDYLWTAPNINSIEIKFEDNRSVVNSGLLEYEFVIMGNNITLKNNNMNMTSVESISKNTYYYDMQVLKLKTIQQQRWVPYTTHELQTVPVMKTRTVPVTTIGANGMPSTSFRTETYSDMETRTVPVTKYRWETYYTKTLDIPEYKYYRFDINDEITFLLYKIEVSGETKYYLQNVAYKYVVYPGEGYFGDKEMKIIFTDNDSNGLFFDSIDNMYFNSWNPYNKKSKYIPVKGFIENKWYSLKYVEKNKMLIFDYDENYDTLSIGNLNDNYVGNKMTGRLIINNLKNKKAVLYLNGNKYRTTKVETGRKCEYGKYVLRIVNPGFNDYETVFEINYNNPEVVIDYKEPDKAGVLKIENIFSDNFSVSVLTEKTEEKIYNNQKEISILEGPCEIEIYYDGFIYRKKLDVKCGMEYILDFEEELKKSL